MNAQLITAPGRFDLYVSGERFTTYDTAGNVPGFSVLHAEGLRPVTRAAVAQPGLWLAHGNVNGVSFGAIGPCDRPAGRIVTNELLARRGSQSVGFRHECAWIAPGGECLLYDQRTVRVASAPSSGALLDVTIRLTAPPASTVTLGQTEDALLCMCLSTPLLPSGSGQLRNSADQFGPEGIHGRQAAWCACNGVVQGQTVGMAFLDHPGNPWYPSPWLCREDGVLSPTPFPWRSHTLEPGRSLGLRYRIIVHMGYVEAGWVRARLADWLRE